MNGGRSQEGNSTNPQKTSTGTSERRAFLLGWPVRHMLSRRSTQKGSVFLPKRKGNYLEKKGG